MKKNKIDPACAIIYQSTKEAVETGDTESLFYDPKKVKKLVGVMCKRVEKSQFVEIPLDPIDILMLEMFLTRTCEKYYKGQGVREFIECRFIGNLVVSADDVKQRTERYKENGLIIWEETQHIYGVERRWMATDRLVRLANNKHATWDKIVYDNFTKPYEEQERIEAEQRMKELAVKIAAMPRCVPENKHGYSPMLAGKGCRFRIEGHCKMKGYCCCKEMDVHVN